MYLKGNIHFLVIICQEVITPGSRGFFWRNKYTLNFIVNKIEHLNYLLCLQFKLRKWALDHGNTESYCGIKD